MIKAAAHDEKTKRRLIILGLEDGNISRLKEGKPIHIHADELGFAGEIIIMYGRTQDDIRRQLEPAIGPDTDVQDRNNERKN